MAKAEQPAQAEIYALERMLGQHELTESIVCRDDWSHDPAMPTAHTDRPSTRTLALGALGVSLVSLAVAVAALVGA